MGYNVRQVKAIAAILETAEEQIYHQTGMKCKIMLCNSDINKSAPEEILNVIATALDAPISWFRERSRRTEIVELRAIAAHILKRELKNGITQIQIGALFGGLDHTTVGHAINTAQNLIDTNDMSFIWKYNMAWKEVRALLKISADDKN